MLNAEPDDTPRCGIQTPRIAHTPDYYDNSGAEAIDVAAKFGLLLDPWQAGVLTDALGEDDRGDWTSFEVGLCAPRQNGKTETILARILAGLFVFGEELIVYSAHEFRTAKEAMRDLENLLRGKGQLYRPNRAHGEESIELPPNKRFPYARRVMFQTRTMSGGRGLTGDTVFLDEAMILKTDAVQALIPTLSARRNPQVWYVGSAVFQRVHPHGEVFAGVRRRALHASSPRLCYKEWSCPEEAADTPTDPAWWRMANPGMGYRISTQYISSEYEAFKDINPRGWLAERLGIGDWPSLDAAPSVFDVEAWEHCAVPDAPPPRAVALVIAVAQDRQWSCIGVAGPHTDGRTIVLCHSIALHPNTGRGTTKLVTKISELLASRDVTTPIMLAGEQAKALRPDLTKAGVEHNVLNRNEMGAACAAFQIAVTEHTLVHVAQTELSLAVRNAKTRMVGESEQWDRRDTAIDDSPLVACSGAFYLWGIKHLPSYDVLKSVR